MPISTSYNRILLARRRTFLFLLLASCALGYQDASADTFTVLHTFTGHDSTTPANSDGKNPLGGLYQASDGYLYGTTAEGGGITSPLYYENGTIFKIGTNGSNYQILWDFPEQTIDLSYVGIHYYSYLATYGKRPTGALTQDPTTGQLCGTTFYGGFAGYYDTPTNPHYAYESMGTMFRLTPGGSTPEDFVSFDTRDSNCQGSNPQGPVLAGAGGYFYGTVAYPGYSTIPGYSGTQGGAVFRSTLGSPVGSGTIDYLNVFVGSTTATGGYYPSGNLVADSNGNLYGTTLYGGPNTAGVVYKLTKPAGASTSWPQTVLHTFNGTDGFHPTTGLLYYPVDGTYYGTTPLGGASGLGNIYKMDSSGNFLDSYGAVIPSGTDTLYKFIWSGGKGLTPNSPLILGSDGNFYGTTKGYWQDGYLFNGTIYRLTPSGIVSTIHTFGASDGDYTSSPSGTPVGGYPYNVMQGTDGALYGTTPKEVYRCQLDSEAALQVAGGHAHGVGLMADGTVWTWGDNALGQLGDGTVNDNKNPVQVLISTSPRTPLTGITAVASGYDFGVALKSDGTVWTWGSNSNGQLGNNTLTDSSIAVQVVDASGNPLTNVSAIAAGQYHAVALKNLTGGDGSVWSWGKNSSGQLGTGNTTQSMVPVQALTSTGMAHGYKIYAGGNSTAAVASSNTVYTWGSNTSGQLGDGTTTSRTSPTHITSLDTSGGVSVGSLSIGYNHMLARKTNSTAWAWGDNTYGQLGNGTTTGALSPQQITGQTGITSVFAGTYYSRSMGSAHYTYAWGYDSAGQLGDGNSGTGATQTSPVHITPLDTSGGVYVTSLSGGSFFGLAIRSDGTVAAWGQNSSGQLGNGKTASVQTSIVKTIGFLDY